MLDIFAGNHEIKETINSIVKSGRFPHAFIIEGEQGSGRHTLARIIASAAICSAENAPCSVCRECELISRDGHCDVLTYKPDGATFKIDTVREIRDNAYITPIEAGRKVNILLDCDKMNEPAQNAFLKVLEEPPSFMVFILICRNASSLLATVRSRCVTLTVQNPDFQEAIDFIAQKTGKPTDDITEVLTASHGNIGKALELLSGTAAQGLQAATAFFDAVKQHDRLKALKAVYPFEKDRLGFTAFLAELRLIAQRQVLKCAEGQGEISSSAAPRLLKSVEEAETKFLRHVGQPLSIPLTSSALCAEIFA